MTSPRMTRTQTTVELKKGHGSVSLSVEKDKIIDTILGKEIPPLSFDRIEKIIRRGVRKTAPSAIEEKKIIVIIPDNTRLWAGGDRFVPAIVKTVLEMGVSPEAIKVMIALGTHAPIPSSGFAELAGAFCDQHPDIEIINSASATDDTPRLVPLGTTSRGTELTVACEACEADHVIVFGGILHHMLAGFGGGRKYILPGIAGYDAIQQNHSLAIDADGRAHPMVSQARLEGNPVNEDIEEAARMFLKDKTSCYVAVAANGAGELFHADVGPMTETFLTGCEKVNDACAVSVSKPGDFALISAGGHRTDGQLYQATKALFNAVNVVRKGGEILLVAEAAQGIGNPAFGAALKQFKDHPETLGKQLTKTFDMPSYVAFRVLDILHRYRVTLLSSFDRNETLAMGFQHTNEPDLNQYAQNLKGRGYIIPFAENILPLETGSK